jgi:dolichol kinase
MNATAAALSTSPTDGPARLAERIFRITLGVTVALTAFALLAAFTGIGERFAGRYELGGQAAFRLLFTLLFMHGVWAMLWYGLKNLLLAKFVGMSREDRREVFSSRLTRPFDLAGLLARYSERRIRITDMIGRRGRFMTLGFAGFWFLYADIQARQPATFVSAFTAETLIDGLVLSWLTLACYRFNGFVPATVYGSMTRIMDGALARANNLTIVTLWVLFKFTMVPIGARLASLYPPEQFAVLFALIWGTYLVVDTMSEVGGSLYGTMKIRVLGVGEVNRKSIAGTVTGFLCGLAFAVGLVLANDLPAGFVAMAVALAVSSSALELASPRGTDDFTMATANALIVWAFGAWVLSPAGS